MNTLDTTVLSGLLLALTLTMVVQAWVVWKAIFALVKIQGDPKPKEWFSRKLQWSAKFILFVFIIVGAGTIFNSTIILYKGVVRLWLH